MVHLERRDLDEQAVRAHLRDDGLRNAQCVDAALDHRMVMASAIAGCAGAGCSIAAAETVASSYPDFFDDLERLS